MYVDSIGQLVVLALDEPRARSARAQLTAFAATTLGISARPVVVRAAAHDFRALRRAFRAVLRMPDEGVTAYDIDERQNAVVVGAADAEAAAALRSRIESIPALRGIVRVELRPAPKPEVTIQQYFRPIVGGLQITGGLGSCTGAFTVYPYLNSKTIDYSQAYLATASHCTINMGVVNGDDFGQPSLANVIGDEALDPPFFTYLQNPDCPPGRQCRYTDIALIAYRSGVTFTHRQFALLSPPSLSISSTATFTNMIFNLSVGADVRKIGASTGLTIGKIVNTCVTIPHIVNGVDTNIRMLCQDEADYTSSSGDSGGTVYSMAYNQPMCYGVHSGAFESRRFFSVVSLMDRDFGRRFTCGNG